MLRIRSTTLSESFAFLLTFVFVLSLAQGVSLAGNKPATVITHTANPYYIPGYRLLLAADIADAAGLKEVRCYFKLKVNVEPRIAAMKSVVDSKYLAKLPAPWVGSEYIEYYFVAENVNGVVTKSNAFRTDEKKTTAADEWKKNLRAEVRGKGSSPAPGMPFPATALTRTRSSAVRGPGPGRAPLSDLTRWN